MSMLPETNIHENNAIMWWASHQEYHWRRAIITRYFHANHVMDRESIIEMYEREHPEVNPILK